MNKSNMVKKYTAVAEDGILEMPLGGTSRAAALHHLLNLVHK